MSEDEIHRDYVYQFVTTSSLADLAPADSGSNLRLIAFYNFKFNINLFPSVHGDERMQGRCRKSLEAYLKPRLAFQCLALCKQIQENLPKKLRDIIYGYIIRPRIRNIESSMFDPNKRLYYRPTFPEILDEQDCMDRE